MSILLGEGHVYHTRTEGVENSFKYPTFFLQFKCEKNNAIHEKLDRQFHGFFSLSAKNYLNGFDASFDSVIKNFLLENCNYEADQVWLHTLPSQFGYVFNPVSFWFCMRADELDAVLVEVNNTFGERHFYWVYPKTGIANQWLKAEKVFHVSPFFPVDGYYQFRFLKQSTHTLVDINYHAPDGKLRLATRVEGNLTKLDQHTFYELIRRYGWITVMIILRIHYQALRLWLKKAKFYSKPNLPEKKVSS